MFRKLFILAAFFVVVPFAGCDEDMPHSPLEPRNENEQTRVLIYFAKDVPLVEALRLGSGEEVNVELINVSFEVDEKTWLIALPVKRNASLENIEQALQARYTRFLDDVAAVADTLSDEVMKKDIAMLGGIRPRMGDFSATSLVITGSASGLDTFKAKSRFLEKTVILPEAQSSQRDQTSTTASTPFPQAGAVSFISSSPNNGCRTIRNRVEPNGWQTLVWVWAPPVARLLGKLPVTGDFRNPAGAKIKVRCGYSFWGHDKQMQTLNGSRTKRLKIDGTDSSTKCSVLERMQIQAQKSTVVTWTFCQP